MKTRCFIYFARFISAVFILMLCGLLAVGVCADGQESDSSQSSAYRPPADSKGKDQAGSKRDESQYKPSGDDNRTPPPKSNDNPPSQKPDSSKESNPPPSSYRPDQTPDKNTSRSDSGSEEHRITTAPKGNDNSSSKKPDTNTSQPNESSNNSSKNDSKPQANPYRPEPKAETSTSNPGRSEHNVTTGQTRDGYHPNPKLSSPQSGSEEHRIITTPAGSNNGSYEHRITSSGTGNAYRPGYDDHGPRDYQSPGHRKRSCYYPPRPKPYCYRYWVFDNYSSDTCRRSVYFNYGYFPYVRVAHVQNIPYTVVDYQSTRDTLENGYYLSKYATSLDRALMDIRDAWIAGKYELIDKHLDINRKIAVFLDGKYDYSVTAYDYADMTSDAVEEIQTVVFMWDDIKQRTNGDYTAFGKHVFYDSNGNVQAVHVSYTLQGVGQDYVIVEVGSSNSPLL